MSKTAVIGAGAWGTTLAILLSQNGHDVSIWSYEKETAEDFKTLRENKKYLPGFQLPPKIDISNDIKTTAKDSELIVFAVPTQFMRNAVKEASPYIAKGAVILSASKGIEISTLKRPSEIISEFIKEPIAVISGPNLAKEIAAGLPAASVAASENESVSRNVQLYFKNCKNFRVYTSNDPTGVELGGALKNIIAIAAGALDQKKLGDNAKASLIIRGIAEITRLGVAIGAKAETFSGLSGLGDLIVTCQSKLSRNHTVGARLADGEKLSGILSSMKEIAEGIPTTQAAVKLRDKYKVEMPIISEVYSVLFENKNIDKALETLMSRPQKSEF